jgi:hypothetical protein
VLDAFHVVKLGTQAVGFGRSVPAWRRLRALGFLCCSSVRADQRCAASSEPSIGRGVAGFDLTERSAGTRMKHLAPFSVHGILILVVTIQFGLGHWKAAATADFISVAPILDLEQLDDVSWLIERI